MESFVIRPGADGFAVTQGNTCLATFETQKQAIQSATARHWIEANKDLVDLICDDGYISTTIN